MTDGSEKHMQKPPFRFEWNLNTVVVLVGLAGGIYAWGGTVNQLEEAAAQTERNSLAIQQLQEDNRRYDRLEYRATTIEEAASNERTALRDLQAVLAELASDMRVMREIVQRMDEARPERSTFQGPSRIKTER